MQIPDDSQVIDLNEIDNPNDVSYAIIRYKKSNLQGVNILETESKMIEKIQPLLCGFMKDTLEAQDVKEPRIKVDGITYYDCGPSNQVYETISGPITISRHTYQSSEGGKRICPLESCAGMIKNSTPFFAKIVTSKATEMSPSHVVDDLKESLNRTISPRYVKYLTDEVGQLAIQKEIQWSYEIPSDIPMRAVKALSLGLDGAFLHSQTGEWREAMVGTIGLLDENANLLYTIRIGAGPEHGKETFYKHLEKEWQIVKQKFPNIPTQGLADGARQNWILLDKITDFQLLDFYHLSTYLGKAAIALYGSEDCPKSIEFLDFYCPYIKHHNRGVYKLINFLEGKLKSNKEVKDKKALQEIIVYLKNNAHRTKYKNAIDNGFRIGSGVAESTCKSLIKSRL
jgi:hypothetical protein